MDDSWTSIKKLTQLGILVAFLGFSGACNGEGTEPPIEEYPAKSDCSGQYCMLLADEPRRELDKLVIDVEWTNPNEIIPSDLFGPSVIYNPEGKWLSSVSAPAGCYQSKEADLYKAFCTYEFPMEFEIQQLVPTTSVTLRVVADVEYEVGFELPK